MLKIHHAALLACLVAPMAMAGEHEHSHHEHASDAPPPHAAAACEGKKAGDKVEYTGTDDKPYTGVCHEHEGKLVLIPDTYMGAPGGHHD